MSDGTVADAGGPERSDSGSGKTDSATPPQKNVSRFMPLFFVLLHDKTQQRSSVGTRAKCTKEWSNERQACASTSVIPFDNRDDVSLVIGGVVLLWQVTTFFFSVLRVTFVSADQVVPPKQLFINYNYVIFIVFIIIFLL